ncbi:diguanylate cyclase [uncultured Pseudoteredinibacter sp.]|uniref:diguanylate cyclase domain-containing protein n=1 Tax=uncultured Pseudoteredinibacter sp. TaxID=1641701 RepID=UPI00261AE6B6|nr:diguanylate cyclase [uncultured Pseudoteredinibacter sp.]
MLRGISIRARLLWYSIALSAIIIASLVGLHNSALEAVESTALQSARAMAMTMNAARIHYNKNVAKPLSKQNDIYIGADYHGKKLALPNPATFTIEVAEMVSQQQPNIRVRMFSEHPFPNRIKDGGAKSDFEKLALQKFREQKAAGKEIEAVFKSSHQSNKLSFDYVEPLVMQEGCIGCHNSLPDSPKTDWKVGDIRGGLSIHHAMVNTPSLSKLENIAKLSIFLIAASSIFMLVWSYRQSKKQLQSSTQDFLKIANSDPLTGLLNRRGFEEALQHSWGEHQRHRQDISVIYCDLDNFKSLNDKYGHASGDMQLIGAASLIRNTLRQGVDFAARIGGDEFVIVLSNTNLKGAEKVAKRLIDSSRSYNGEHPMLWSLGVASSKVFNAGNPKTLISKADQAMYRAKSSVQASYHVHQNDSDSA